MIVGSELPPLITPLSLVAFKLYDRDGNGVLDSSVSSWERCDLIETNVKFLLFLLIPFKVDRHLI